MSHLTTDGCVCGSDCGNSSSKKSEVEICNKIKMLCVYRNLF